MVSMVSMVRVWCVYGVCMVCVWCGCMVRVPFLPQSILIRPPQLGILLLRELQREPAEQRLPESACEFEGRGGAVRGLQESKKRGCGYR